MASCLVPDFPAVMVALEHLKELDKQLKEDGVAVSAEASLHLAEITAAISELEADRRASHEHLEVETIENGKLRHQMNNIRERMSQDVMADVAAARASNAEETEQLQKELLTLSQLREVTEKKQEVLLSQNEALYPERERLNAQNEEIVAAMNDKLTFECGLQMQLDRTQEQIEELKSHISAVRQDIVTLQHNMVLERQAFAAKRDGLSTEVDQFEGQIKQQEQAIERSMRQLDRVNDMKQESRDHLGELAIHMARLESNLRRLTDTRCRYEEQLEGETQKHQELRQQREPLEKQLCELVEAFSINIQRLQEEMTTLEGKIEEGRASRLLRRDSLARIYEVFKYQSDEENEVRLDYLHVSQQLERSRLQLEERIVSIVRHSKEIKEMDKRVAELLEADTINKRVFKTNQEDMSRNVDEERRKFGQLEEHKRQLSGLLEEAKRKQEEHVAKVTSDICSTRRRYQELGREEAALQQQQPRSVDVNLLMSFMSQCEEEFRLSEAKQRQEIEQHAAEAESVRRSNEEQQRKLEEEEERLKEVEAIWSEERVRHERLQTMITELRGKTKELELSIERLKEKTSSLLQPKEELKAGLEAMRESYIDTLTKQASELRAAEMSIYDDTVKLEQVSMENSRLRLCIRQMTEAVSRARQDKDTYRQDIQQFRRDTQALFELLQEAWREDFTLTQVRQSSDSVLLASTSTMANHVKSRRRQLGDVGALLHQQMLEFSRRLGDQTAGVSVDV